MSTVIGNGGAVRRGGAVRTGSRLLRRGMAMARVARPFRLTLVTIMAGALLQAQAQGSGEYAVKAAFLYNFARFVEWPGEALGSGGAPLLVGVVGDDPFGSSIDQTVAGKNVNGHPIAVRRLKWGQNLRQCHILFISSSEARRLPQILESLRGSSVLTVADMDRFDQQGGIVRFLIEEGKVRFEINVDAADQAGLRISSKLLALAKIVRAQR
jgi:hypothetical protein